MFDPYSYGEASPKRQPLVEPFDAFCSSQMLTCAKRILLTSHESDEAYLGALTVLMLNNQM